MTMEPSKPWITAQMAAASKPSVTAIMGQPTATPAVTS